MALTNARLREIVAELVSRPKHEKVRALVYTLLVDGLGASSTEIDFEKPLPEVRGRTDALLGRTVFEFKSDLRRETSEAEEELSRYLPDRERTTGERFVGIATDGASFVPYEIRDGELRRLAPYTPPVELARDLLVWLSAAVAVSADLRPDPETVRRELGKQSLAWHMAREELAKLWAGVNENPEARLKRELWAGLLERVYGASVDNDDLFFQHTYLTIVAKTMAVHVLGLDMPEPAALLAGRPFSEIGITGVVESDFFDWPLAAAGGAELVRRIATQAARFRLRDVESDVLKGLYESLIDPEQRHDLGEYYTPDWLAAKMCERAIERPLEQRVLDPACGSGTFLFHAVRRYLAAADEAGKATAEALDECCQRVRGIDVHPVAVQIARVTYLLALGGERLRARPDELSIPVYIGDSLQWNTTGFMTRREIEIKIPDEKASLHFPFSVAQDPGLFDAVINRMLALSERDGDAAALINWLNGAEDISDGDSKILVRTYEHLRKLKKAGRNHIWGFVARNLVRPAWLSREDERADVIIGNPPWLSYRYMSREMQRVFKSACEERGIWVGQVAQQSDLSAYFFARCVELYFQHAGVIAFVMPYAAMSRRQFEGFRKGIFGRQRGKSAERMTFMRFVEAWAFSDDVQPLFPVPSCVLLGELRSIGGTGRVLPETVQAASGRLPRRDATPEEAAKALTWRTERWPAERPDEPGSFYSGRFRDGAVIFPSVLFRVERAPSGRLGSSSIAPVVQSRRTNLEKRPWRDVASLRGNIESRFLRKLYLGESIAPYRLLQPILSVIPWDSDVSELLDADSAQRRGYLHLARWLGEARAVWEEHGRRNRTLLQQIDYWRQLTAQLPPAPLRVVYAASGTLPAVAILRDDGAICEHKLYWAAAEDESEACYLCCVLNSETARTRVAHRQSRGQWGARDFDKVMLELPIPKFDAGVRLHMRLAKAGERAEGVAGQVPLKEGEHFVRTRGRIREALREDGVSQRIDELVEELLSGAGGSLKASATVATSSESRGDTGAVPA